MIELSYNVFDLPRHFCPKDYATLLFEMSSLYILNLNSNLVVIVIMVTHIYCLSRIHAGTGN